MRKLCSPVQEAPQKPLPDEKSQSSPLADREAGQAKKWSKDKWPSGVPQDEYTTKRIVYLALPGSQVVSVVQWAEQCTVHQTRVF
jgi:hypothetical protein